MDDLGVQIIQLETGQKVLVQAETSMGPVNSQGEVIYVGGHHFRIRCKSSNIQNNLVPDQDVRVSLSDKSGLLPVVTQFIRSLDKDPRILILKLPSGKWRQNRRAFFRGDLETNITIFRSDGTRVQGRTVNLSGGGALITIDTPLKLHEEIQIMVEFNKKESVGSRARVVRMSESKTSEEFGIKFVGISNRDQNYICRLVLVDEFENRRAEIRELTGRT